VTMTISKKFAWRPYCEACEWVGDVYPSSKAEFYSDANAAARLELGLHYTLNQHMNDGPDPQNPKDNIGSWGVELLHLQRAQTMHNKLTHVG
jgi:hypothetical protein